MRACAARNFSLKRFHASSESDAAKSSAPAAAAHAPPAGPAPSHRLNASQTMNRITTT